MEDNKLGGASVDVNAADDTLRTAFYNIFKVEERPSFLKTNILDLSVILLTLSLLVAVSFSNVVFKKFLFLAAAHSLTILHLTSLLLLLYQYFTLFSHL